LDDFHRSISDQSYKIITSDGLLKLFILFRFQCRNYGLRKSR